MIGYDSGFERAIIRVSKINKCGKVGAAVSRVLAALMRIIWPCDIDPDATIGKICIPHAVGIVIGCSAVIEDDVLIMSGVVIGSRYGHSEHKGHAHIKKGALLGANCVILGRITIGEGAKIGGGAVVTKDVPPHAVVVGNNRIIHVEDGIN